jgi:hypoxanthine phosphoribosyltransferase
MSSIPFQGQNLHLFLDTETIGKRVSELAAELNQRYAESAVPPVLMPVLSGALRFTAELLPRLNFAYDINCVKVSTYPEGDTATLDPSFQLGFTLDLEQRPVIVLEDILDTGSTLTFLHSQLAAIQASEVFTAVLLHKVDAGSVIQPDWVGFPVPEKFLVGYGLDYSGRLRHLHGIYALE